MTTKDITLLPYRDRVKLVQARLQRLRYPTVAPLPEPPRVATARAVVEAFVQKSEAHYNAARAVRQAELNAITDALLLGETAQAVALLQKLEAADQGK